MAVKKLPNDVKRDLLEAQRNEISEHIIYLKLSESINDEKNGRILKKIAMDEKSHHDTWKKYTGVEVSPKRIMVWWYYLISRIFGLTFGIKLMERGEGVAQENYKKIIVHLINGMTVDSECRLESEVEASLRIITTYMRMYSQNVLKREIRDWYKK